MSRLPKPTGLPLPKTNFLSKAKSTFNLNVQQPSTSKKEIPKVVPKIQNLRAPLSRRSKTVSEISRNPLVPLNRGALTVKTTVPLRTASKRPCLIVPDVKPKVAKVAVTVPKTGRKSLKNTAPIPKKSKPAPYDYKARFGLLQEKHTSLVEKYKCLEERSNELETKVTGLDDNLCKYESENIELRKDSIELKVLQPKFEKLSKDFEQTSKVLEECREELEASKNYNETLQQKLSISQNIHSNLESENKYLKKELDEHKALVEEYKNRIQRYDLDSRKLRNEILDLKGNIRVFCRIRPPLSNELSRTQYNINYLDEASIELCNTRESIDPSGKPRPNNLQFSFDKVFTPESMQQDIFMELSQLVQSALDGYNVCVFAYGQTGSGKTYTMEGHNTEEALGMIPRAIDLIFKTQEEVKKIGWEYTVHASFLEIYNDKINDLLDLKNKQDLKIQMVDQTCTDVYVTNLTTHRITSGQELKKYMAIAQKNRAVAATENNERSSRSHSVARIQIEGINEIRNETIKSSLNLVDLAGSEKVQKEGTSRLDETKNINKSLANLGHVILSLKENNGHVPYRNCKLTYLLRPSLGGNSKTLMLVNIAPFEECFTESVNSLRFATTVNKCKTGGAKKNKTRTAEIRTPLSRENSDLFKTPRCK